MNEQLKARLGDVIQMINYMGTEIKHNISKYILAVTNEADKYAIKFYINPNMKVGFALLNTENQSMAFKEYTYEEFAGICSDVIKMETVFTKLADDLVACVQENLSQPKELKEIITLL